MSISIVLTLMGGLALFLYGMQMMSSGLESAAGNKMKELLERLTSNRLMGVLVGAGITAVIQSSSATTVMVIGFVNSGLMTLQQAVWIIMGANIGTTVTGLLIALDVGQLAPLFAFIGVVLVVFVKKQRFHHWGNIIAGFGILFIGMQMMSSSMLPLRESEAFVSLMTQFSNPLFGILAGAVFTAVIQSSSASIGILQALAMDGLIDLGGAVYVLFGQNIGTCVTALLASAGTSRNAKRTTVIHLAFNLIGTTLFTVLCMTTPLTQFVAGLAPLKPAGQIANMHVLFNVATTLLLLPFGKALAKLAVKILPDVEAKADEKAYHLEYIKPVEMYADRQIGNTAVAISSIERELKRMFDMARHNVDNCWEAILDGNSSRLADVEYYEEYIDYLNKEISNHISKHLACDNNQQDSDILSSCFKVSGNIERIGDHAINICEYTKMIEAKKIHFSDSVIKEIEEMRRVSAEAVRLLDSGEMSPTDRLAKIAAIEQKIDDMTDLYRNNQLRRMREGTCEGEAGILYSEMLTDFERIGDHILNLGEEIAKSA